MASFTDFEDNFDPDDSSSGAQPDMGGTTPLNSLLQWRQPARKAKQPEDRLLRLPEVLSIFPVSRSTWYDSTASSNQASR